MFIFWLIVGIVGNRMIVFKNLKTLLAFLLLKGTIRIYEQHFVLSFTTQGRKNTFEIWFMAVTTLI